MAKKTKMELLRQIESATGTLDFCEFIIDPKNSRTTPDEIGFHLREYFKVLGIFEDEWRTWLLQKMQEAREAKIEALKKEICG